MRLHFLVILLFLSIKSNGQDNCIIVGRWSVINVRSTGFFYNIQTDSISLTGLLKEIYPDSINKQRVFHSIRHDYGALDYEFYENGVYKMFMDTSYFFEGTYKLISSENIIELIPKDALDQETGQRIRFNIKGGFLLFEDKDGIDKLQTVLKQKW